MSDYEGYVTCDECPRTFVGFISLGVHKARAHGPKAGWSTKRRGVATDAPVPRETDIRKKRTA